MVPNRKISVSTFGFALVCFALPFATVSCAGVDITLSGLELAMGTTIEMPTAFGQVEENEVSREPLAICALTCVLAGLALAVFTRGRPPVLLTFGAGGALCLLLLAVKLGADLEKQGEGLLTLDLRFGYYLCLLSLLAIAAVSGYGLRQLQRETSPGASRLPP